MAEILQLQLAYLNARVLHWRKWNRGIDAFWGCGEKGFEVEGDTFFVLAMKAYRGSKGIAPFIFNLGTCGGEELTLGSGRSIPGKDPDTLWIGVWVGPRASLDFLKSEVSCPCWDLNPGSSNL